MTDEEIKEYKLNELILYRNYLFALKEREEYGDKYGDTDEIIKNYEENLNIKVKKLRYGDK